MPDDKSNSYAIGYRKPPLGSRFKRGQSGNPKGRPKRSKNFSSLLEDAFNQKVTIREGERRRKISKREVMATQLANKAISGNHKFIQLAITLLLRHELTGQDGAPLKVAMKGPPPPLTEEEEAARTLEIARLMKELGLLDEHDQSS